MDNVYVRLTEPREIESLHQFIDVRESQARVWMTNMTLQGNGDGSPDCGSCRDCKCGLGVVREAKLYAESATVLCTRSVVFSFPGSV